MRESCSIFVEEIRKKPFVLVFLYLGDLFWYTCRIVLSNKTKVPLFEHYADKNKQTNSTDKLYRVHYVHIPSIMPILANLRQNRFYMILFE